MVNVMPFRGKRTEDKIDSQYPERNGLLLVSQIMERVFFAEQFEDWEGSAKLDQRVRRSNNKD